MTFFAFFSESFQAGMLPEADLVRIQHELEHNPSAILAEAARRVAAELAARAALEDEA